MYGGGNFILKRERDEEDSKFSSKIVARRQRISCVEVSLVTEGLGLQSGAGVFFILPVSPVFSSDNIFTSLLSSLCPCGQNFCTTGVRKEKLYLNRTFSL